VLTKKNKSNIFHSFSRMISRNFVLFVEQPNFYKKTNNFDLVRTCPKNANLFPKFIWNHFLSKSWNFQDAKMLRSDTSSSPSNTYSEGYKYAWISKKNFAKKIVNFGKKLNIFEFQIPFCATSLCSRSKKKYIFFIIFLQKKYNM